VTDVRRSVPLLLIVALAACGARTGLEEELTQADAEADAITDAKMEGDAPTDARTFACPLIAPMGGSCPESLGTTLCAYSTVGPQENPSLVEWACLGGGWVNCTGSSNASFTCGQIVCSATTAVECIVDGKECCVCNTPTGTVSQCSPCS
jgi:hypothetical protein